VTSLVPYYARLARQSGYSIAKGVALPFVRPEAVAPVPGTTLGPVLVTSHPPWETARTMNAAVASRPAINSGRRASAARRSTTIIGSAGPALVRTAAAYSRPASMAPTAEHRRPAPATRGLRACSFGLGKTLHGGAPHG